MRRLLVIAALAVAAPAAADPIGPRVVTAPTAWLAGAGEAEAMLGFDHRGHSEARATYGLGGLAEAELAGDRDAGGAALGRAAFRLGVRQWHGWPALTVGVRASFAGARQISDAYVVASRDLGVVRLHAGLDALSFASADDRHAARLRPLAGLELHPPMYPRSSLIGDVAWQPSLDATDPKLAWLLGIGVRFQALPWASIELAVRARQAEALGDSTVILRVNAVWRKPR
jgi:hypothetical protein